MSPTVLANLIVAGLIAGLTLFIAFRRPPPELWPALLSYQLCAIALVAGHLLANFASPPWSAPVGAVLIYGGSIIGSAVCWVVALRYAEAQHWPFPWDRPAWVWGPVGAAALVSTGAAVLIVRGTLPLPLETSPGSRPGSFYAVAVAAGLFSWGATALYGALAIRTSDAAVRRSAALMGGILAVVLVAGILAVSAPTPGPIDPSIYGVAATSVIFLMGAYRTRVISVLSTALRHTLDYDADAVVLIDSNGLWLHSNPAATRLLGSGLAAARVDVIDRITRDLCDTEGRMIDRQALASQVLANGKSGGGVLGPYRIDGSRWIRLAATAIPTRRRRRGPVSLRLHDVTDSQRAEAALRNSRDELEQRIAERTRELEVTVARLEEEVSTRRRAEVELRRNEERHRAISEVSTDLSFAFHIEGDAGVNWQWITQSANTLTGYSNEEFMSLGWRAVVHPDDLDAILEHRGGLMRGEPVDIELRVLSKSGEIRWLEVNIRGTPGDTPGTLRAVGAVRDITERKRTSEELRLVDRRAQETQRLESLGVLAGGIAHDFNNLLAVISGNATLATTELASPDALQKRIDRIRSAADYAVALTDQILTYAGKPALMVEVVDLGALVASMLDLLRASTTPKVRIEIQLCDDLPTIEGDPTQIRQIVMNLISNAAESFEEPHGRILVRTGWIHAGRPYLSGAHGTTDPQPGDYVYVEVVDNGRGIDEESRQRIFEPFFSTKFSGRGLGLAAVHGIIQAHSGVIKLTSEPGWGTAFRVLFPRSEQPLGIAAIPAPDAGEVARPNPPTASATVLVVDDEEAVLEIAKEFLQRADFRVVTAGGGIEAVRRIEEMRDDIDVVVLDLSMPDIDGEQTFREIRRLRPDVPVLLVSGYSEELAAVSFADTGWADAFLSKPYLPETLIQRVREVLVR